MGTWGVGRREPLNLGGEWKLLSRKNQEREGGRGWKRGGAETQT